MVANEKESHQREMDICTDNKYVLILKSHGWVKKSWHPSVQQAAELSRMVSKWETNPRAGLIIHWHMGFGKTYMYLLLLAWLFYRFDDKRVLLVAPKSILEDGVKSAKTLMGNKIVTIIYCKRDRAKFLVEMKYIKSPIIMFTTPETLARDMGKQIPHFDTVAVDESHIIRNDTDGSIAVRRTKTTRRLFITGTMLINSQNDIIPALQMLHPDANFSEYNSLKVNDKITFLQNYLNPVHSFRPAVKRDDIAINVITEVVPLSDAQKHNMNLLDQTKKNIFVWTWRSKANLLDPRLLNSDTSSQDYRTDGMVVSPKTKRAMEKLREYKSQNRKVVIVSSMVVYLKIMRPQLEVEFGKVCLLDGSLTLSQRSTQIKEFREGKADILLMTKSLAVGLNLECATAIFIMDTTFTASSENQAENRIIRITQKKDVDVVFFICKNDDSKIESVDSRMLSTQHRKSMLQDALFNTDSQYHERYEDIRDIEEQ